jgi:hypothetical protein
MCLAKENTDLITNAMMTGLVYYLIEQQINNTLFNMILITPQINMTFTQSIRRLDYFILTGDFFRNSSS